MEDGVREYRRPRILDRRIKLPVEGKLELLKISEQNRDIYQKQSR